MNNNDDLSRRAFLAATAGAVASGAFSQTAAAQEGAAAVSRLAIDGGAKAVTEAIVSAARFGDPERERLMEMLGQDALFYWKGPQTTLMMDRFREFCPREYVMTCTSGTAALHIAVCAAGIAPGDEVITSPVTDIGSVIGVIYQNAVPVFADLLPDTYNLDPADVERRITPKTKAIIAVHLGGNPCDMDALRAIADKHGLVLIEDCAQAWAAKYRGKPIGTIGDIACFSLQNSKHITCGDGGVVASSHPEFGPKLQQYGDKGFNRETGKFESFSTNYRMSEPQAAVVAGQLTRLEGIVGTRSARGNALSDAIRDLPGITPYNVHPEDRCSYWFYMFRMDPAAFTCDRAQFVKALSAEGVPCSAGYIATTVHKMPVFLNHAFFAGQWPVKDQGLTTMDFNTHETPEAESILKTAIRVAVHETWSESFIAQCGEAIRKVAKHYQA